MLLLLPQSSGPGGRAALTDGLAAAHRVIEYSQRGTGASSSWSAPMSMFEQASDAQAVLSASGTREVHLFCHSTGCGIGIALAHRSGQRVASLTLVNPWTFGDTYLEGAQRLRIALANALEPREYARYNAALLFPPEYRREYAAHFERQADSTVNRPHNASEIARRLEAILAFDARELLPALNLPSWVIGASDDQLMPPWFASEAAALLPDSRLEVLKGGGHMLTETRAGALLERLLPWYAGLDAAAR
ncbi:MAG: alpha/beta hydrolase [Pseudomonadota bacterium]